MGSLVTIAAKELRVYFTTWTMYVALPLFVVLTAFLFQFLLSEYQHHFIEHMQYSGHMPEDMNLRDLVMGPWLRRLALVLLFLLPALTMRLLAEEKRDKTLAFLCSLPLGAWSLVLGKYVAALVALGVMLGLTLVCPIMLEVWGGPQVGTVLDWSSVATAYFGVYLLGAAGIGVGLLTSSLTESQMIAAISAFSLLFLLYGMGLVFRPDGGRDIWSYLAIQTHLEPFIRGIIRLEDITYFVSLAFLSVFFTCRITELQYWHK